MAGNPEYAEQMAKMQELLDRWTDETGDTVPENPTPDRGTVAGKRNPHAEFPGAAAGADQINAKGPARLN
jgi:arylsulfatase